MRKIIAPMSPEIASDLEAGESVLFSGTLYIGRDAAHKKMVEALENGESLPFDPKGAVIYYAGPAPARPGQVMNSVGPTSSYRMDPFSKALMEVGVKGMIGKGPRNDDLRESLKEYGSAYLVCVGGAAALVAKSIKKQEIIAYEELGAEALRKVEVVDFPCIVGYDSRGNSIIK